MRKNLRELEVRGRSVAKEKGPRYGVGDCACASPASAASLRARARGVEAEMAPPGRGAARPGSERKWV